MVKQLIIKTATVFHFLKYPHPHKNYRAALRSEAEVWPPGCRLQFPQACRPAHDPCPTPRAFSRFPVTGHSVLGLPDSLVLCPSHRVCPCSGHTFPECPAGAEGLRQTTFLCLCAPVSKPSGLHGHLLKLLSPIALQACDLEDIYLLPPAALCICPTPRPLLQQALH